MYWSKSAHACCEVSSQSVYIKVIVNFCFVHEVELEKNTLNGTIHIQPVGLKIMIQIKLTWITKIWSNRTFQQSVEFANVLNIIIYLFLFSKKKAATINQ
jgi:hypothetical protein